MDGLEWKTLLKWMIWGYHYFRKHPFISDSCCGLLISIFCWFEINIFAASQQFFLEASPGKTPKSRSEPRKSTRGPLLSIESWLFNDGIRPT